MFKYDILINNNFNDYFFSLFLINIFVYIIITINIFLILFLFDSKYLKNLNDLKILGNNSSITIYFIIVILSLVGTPPLIGFLSKFLIFIFIIYKKNFFFLFFFLFLNFFSMYFYLQNTRYLINKNVSYKFNINKINSFYLLNIFNFINLYFILFLEDFILYNSYINSYIYF